MRILQINAYFSAGGTARIVNGIYDELVAGGDECLIAAGRTAMVHPHDSYRIGSNLSVMRNALIARIFDNEGFNATATTRRLIATIRNYNPDIVHLHNLHGYYINVQLLFDFLKSYDKPVVWTLHDCWALTGHCAWFTAAGCDKWRTAAGCDHACCQQREYPTCAVGRGRAAQNFRMKRDIFTGMKNLTIVTPSQWLAGCVGDSFLKDYDTEVIYNGVNLTVFHPVESDIRDRYDIGDRTMLLGVATPWIARKGYYDFINLANVLGDDYRIVLVGVSEKQRRELPANVIGIPAVESAAVLAQFYSAADMLLNLSVEETFGLVTVEALACGTPVLVYNSTACPEPIDASCGIVAEKADGIEAIAKIITSRRWRSISQEACIARASQFDSRKQFPLYRRLYESKLRK